MGVGVGYHKASIIMINSQKEKKKKGTNDVRRLISIDINIYGCLNACTIPTKIDLGVELCPHIS